MNINRAGRPPEPGDISLMQKARAVILPQGVPRPLYEAAKQNCRFVFPNYDARFSYPGKIGQTRLFEKTGVSHPFTLTYSRLADFSRSQKNLPELPFILKLDWGGEGDTVFLIQNNEDLQVQMEKVERFEKTGQKGFLIQEFIPSGFRTLRVVVVGSRLISYWRINRQDGEFRANIAKGGREFRGDKALQEKARMEADTFLRKTGINLAGLDFLFSESGTPLFLEINYFFGRRGLGGSIVYYKILETEIRKWIKTLPEG